MGNFLKYLSTYIISNENIFSFQIFLNVMCVFILVTYIRPFILIPTILVGVIFFLLRRFYLQTSRAVKRLEGVTKSPVFSHLSSSLNGLTSIRAFKAQKMMINEFDYHQDIHSSAWFAHLATSRWFGVYLDWIVVLYLACCVLSFLLMPSGKQMLKTPPNLVLNCY